MNFLFNFFIVTCNDCGEDYNRGDAHECPSYGDIPDPPDDSSNDADSYDDDDSQSDWDCGWRWHSMIPIQNY